MDEYISKKDILQMIESTAMWNRSFSVLYEDIEDMKPADVSPVRHGRWIYREFDDEYGWRQEYECSECGKYSYFDTDYCPNCGARMIEEGNT